MQHIAYTSTLGPIMAIRQCEFDIVVHTKKGKPKTFKNAEYSLHNGYLLVKQFTEKGTTGHVFGIEDITSFEKIVRQ